MTTLLFDDRKTETGQWNTLRYSFIHRNYPCEIILNPENDEWKRGRPNRMQWYNGARWIEVALPNLDRLLGRYPGTYTRDPEPKHAAFDTAVKKLTPYLCDWIDTATASELTMPAINWDDLEEQRKDLAQIIDDRHEHYEEHDSINESLLSILHMIDTMQNVAVAAGAWER
jgi:hypothetical protein